MIKVKMNNEVVITDEKNSIDYHNVKGLSTDTTKYFHYTVYKLDQNSSWSHMRDNKGIPDGYDLYFRKDVYFRVDGKMSENHKRKILKYFNSPHKMCQIIENDCEVDEDEWDVPFIMNVNITNKFFEIIQDHKDMMLRSSFIEMDYGNYSSLDPNVLTIGGEDKSHKRGWFFDLSIVDDGNLLVEEETEDNIYL